MSQPKAASQEGQRVCSYYHRSGRCKYGSECRFSHDVATASQAAAFADRKWTYPQASTSGRGPDSSATFRVLSYNILADTLAHEHAHELYRACPRWCLSWSTRGPGILAEIGHWDPDIGCLQEVDRVEQVQAHLRRRGYDTAYAARTGDRADGCLTFWRRSKFTCQHSEALQMRPLGLRDNVALLVMLARQGAPPGEPALLVGNTHLLFNPKRGDIKTAQARSILARMADVQAAAGRPSWALLAGDFNSTPGSAIHRFVSVGALDCAAEDRRNMSGQLENSRLGTSPSQVVYGKANGLAGRPPPRASQQSGTFAPGSLPDSQALHEAHMAHSSSMPAHMAAYRAQECSPPVRVHSFGASAPPLYEHADAAGRAFWSPTPPPAAAAGAPVLHPFYYSPMRVEEPAPMLGSSARLAHSASQHARMFTMSSWDAEQLSIAVGRPTPAASRPSLTKPLSGPPRAQSRGRMTTADLDPAAWIARHPIAPLYSAYAQVLGTEPRFTSCHGRIIDTLDYIWFTPLPAAPGKGRDQAQQRPRADDPASDAAQTDSRSLSGFEHLLGPAALPAAGDRAWHSSSGSAAGSSGAAAGEAGAWELLPTRVVHVPALSALRCGLPAPEFPSDHISLIVEFSMRPVPGQAPVQRESQVPASDGPNPSNHHIRFDED